MCHGLKVSSNSSAITIIVCAVTAFGSAGCRSGNPISRLVRVTPNPDAGHPDIEPPPQRLASASGVGPSSKQKTSSRQDRLAAAPSTNDVAEERSPHVRLRPEQTGDLTPRDAVPKNRSTTMASLDLPRDNVDLDSVRQVAAKTEEVDTELLEPSAGSTEHHFGDRQPASQPEGTDVAVNVADVPADRLGDPASSATAATEASAPTDPTEAAASPSATKRSAPKLSASDYQRIMKAFENYPPAIRREAMQRLAAALAPTAESSAQPNSPTEALRQRLSDLPELPTSTTRDPNRIAKRLGESRLDESAPASAVSAADPVAKAVAGHEPATPPTTAPASSRRRQPAAAMAADASPAVANEDTEAATLSVASDRSDQPASLSVASHPVPADPSGDGSPKPDPTSLRHAAVSNPPRSILQSGSEPTNAPEDSGKLAAVAALGALVSTATAPAIDPNIAEPISASNPVAPVSHVKPASSEELLAKMSDQELFATLVKTLSNAPAGETPAQKASRLIKLRHLKVLAGNPAAIEESLDGMSDSEQSFLRHQLQGLWTMVNPDGHPVPRRRLTHAIEEFRQATYHASAAADALEVRALNFCSELESYGQFTPFAGNRFKPKQEVILYCEVDNFAANKVADGFETNLQGTYDIYDQNGHQVAGQLLPPDRQVAVRIPRDRFVAYRMNLPGDLPAGTYRLQLTMEDLAGKKYGQAEIPFQMEK